MTMTPQPMRLDIMIDYAMRFVGVPYIWGGAHPQQGFDCSGLVQEALASVGLDPPGDQTAASLYDALKVSAFQPIENPTRGALLFFGSPKLSHVAIALSQHIMIEAGGGGDHTKTVAGAIAARAAVRLRPIESRTDLKFMLIADRFFI